MILASCSNARSSVGYSLCVFSQHHWRNVLEPFLHPTLQELLEFLLVQLVQLIHTLLKFALARPSVLVSLAD